MGLALFFGLPTARSSRLVRGEHLKSVALFAEGPLQLRDRRMAERRVGPVLARATM
jgi:hypothetical protein